MKKLIYLSFCSLCIITASHADVVPWWLRPTVCRINPANCYTNMTAGYFIEMGNPESWDKSGNCWGLKLICADALKNPTGDDAVAMERSAILRGENIRNDFDVNELSEYGDCFGRRKTAEGGSMAYVGNTYVPVWCSGILSNPDEFLENGEISTTGENPNCETLAEMGYAFVDNGKCYGKYYNPSEYYIECGSKQEPTRIITLNGADYDAPLGDNPASLAAAESKFDAMYKTSQTQKKQYFSE